MENLYSGKNSKVLDPRGMFIVQGKDLLRIWVGQLIPPANLEPYRQCADKTIKLLQQHERAPTDCGYTKQSEEDERFWRLFNMECPPASPYEPVSEWNPWLIDVRIFKFKLT